MKKEATKKSKLWLWLLIGLAALVAVAGVVLALVLGGGDKETGPVGGRPELYWNLDKVTYTKESQTGLSTREPGEDGVYRVRFAYNGEQLELPIVDKQLVNVIDTYDVMGLVKDADGVVVDVIDPEDFATPIAQNAYVQQVMSDRIIANSSIAMNGMQYTIELGDLAEIYDVSSTAAVAGQIIEATDFQAMDSIWVYANDLEEVTHIYMTDHPATSPVYWRAYQMWNSAEKSTSRVPDENGVYSIDFCSDGGIVTLKCKDKSIVTAIDNKSPHSCHFGFLFDDEGYIIEIMNSGIGIRGAVAAERIEVQELDGNFFSGAQMIPSDGGLSYSATLPENCVIYDASSAAARNGVQGQPVDSLKLGDRICVWTDPMGTPVLVYIANRLEEVPAYYNILRKYDNTLKETTREPNGAGYYEFEVVETGKIGKVTLKTKDKELASFIDSIANRIVGLKVNDGIIENAYTDDDIFGWTSIYGGYVPQIQGTIVSLVSFSKPDSPSNVLMNMNYKVYDVSGKDVPYGTETTLRIGDIATVTRDVSYNGVNIYISRRMVGGDHVYYNLDYQYNSTTKETKRVPDENGWYVFTMAHNGKVVEVKTRDKELATQIDKSMSGDLVCVMRVENGIVKELYETPAAYGQSLRSGYRVSAINGDGTYTVISSTGVEYTLTMAEDCVIYNVSTVYDSFRGERTYSLQIGDMVTSLADYRSNVKLIYVRYRAVDKMYANPQPLYDAAAKVTLRKPDAEGWYWFELSQEGTLKWFKTKDVAIATAVDANLNTPFGLRVNGDEILNVVSAAWVRGVYKAGVTAWDVTSVSGNNAKIKFNKPGYSTTGDTKSIYVGGNVKVYDISPTAETFGAPVKLQAGDRIRTYVDRQDNCVYVFVTHHATRVNGVTGYCEHCKQEVYWHPWAGESWDGVDCHYYMNGNLNLTKQTNVGNATKHYEVVLDLNGYKLNVTGARAFLAFRDDNLSILDSVGGGEVAATGVEGGNGGSILVSGGSTLNLYSGTLSFVDSDIHVFKGAVAYIGGDCTFNMYGGTIKGGIVNSPSKNVQGGNLFLEKAEFNMYGGVIEDGRAERTDGLQPAVAAQGGNIYGLKNSVFNLYDGEIRNGYSNQHGGNVFLSTCTFNMFGGSITGGECRYSGGNLYNQFASVFNFDGTTVKDGKAGAAGNTMYVAHNTAVLNFTAGEVAGDIHVAAAEKITVSGKPVINIGKMTGLSLPSTVMLTIGELSSGAKVAVNAKGAFTVANSKAKSYADAGYIVPAAPRTTIIERDDVLYMEGEESFCEHCGKMVTWYEWAGTTNPDTGHYFVSRDFTQTSQLSIKKDTDVVLDLYGNTYTSEKIRNFLVRGTLSIMDTVGGGEMISTGGEEFAGSIALVGTEAGSLNPAGFNLFSGTLKLAEDHPTFNNGGLIMFSSNGELNVYGGTMIGGNVAMRGGCVNLNTVGGTMNVYGGEIKGGTAGISGGCIDMSGTLNIEGGIIDGEVFIEPSCRGLTIAGSPSIGLLDLTSGIKAEISGMTEGAAVTIKANGTFTQHLDNASAYLNFFTLDESIDGSIRATGDALSVGISEAKLEALNSVYENAVQMTTEGVFSEGGTVTAICPVCGTEEEWIDLAEIAPTSLREDAHYYLSKDIDISTHYGFYSNACVHLNGHNITSAARAFYVEGIYDKDTAVYTIYTLNVMGDGVVTGAGLAHATIPRGVYDVGGNVNFFGGTHISNSNYPAVTGRGFYGQSVINVYEGTEFRGNNVSILARSQAVNMFGGTVTAGTVKVDGESTCEVNLNNVTISNSNVGQNAIHAAGEKGTLNMSGVTVNGVVVAGSNLKSLVLSDKIVIDELHIGDGFLVTLAGLAEETDISVIATDAFTVANDKAAEYLQANYFRPVASNNILREENGVLYMDVEKTFCPHCEQEVVWSMWPGYNSPKSGHYFISGDYNSQTVQWSISAGTDVVLDLRGNTYATNGIRNFLVRGELSIVDTLGGGEMVVSGDPACHGSIAMVSTASGSENPATFNLYSGTLRLAADHAAIARGGLLQFTSGAIMNMYGGTIRDGAATQWGGNVSVEGVACMFNMYGGQILGGTAPAGADVNVNGAFNVENGIIGGQVTITENCDSIKLSGATQIGDLQIAQGKIADVADLASGAKIFVSGEGVFTDSLSDAASFANYFEAKDAGYEIQVVGDTLACVEKIPEEVRLNLVHDQAAKMTSDGVFTAGGTVTAICPVCGTEEQWTDISTVANLKKIDASGHYYLADDLTSTSYIGFYADACLHLNGHNITSSERAVYVDAYYDKTAKVYNVSKLNIMGEGTVSGNGVDHATIPRGTLDIGGTVNLFGGTYVANGTKNPALTARGFNTYSFVNIYNGASFTAPNVSLLARSHGVNMYGGEITNGFVKVDGASACSFNVYGGNIANANAEQTECISAAGEYGVLTINGGTIEGAVVVSATLKDVSVSGAPIVADLDLTSGKLLKVDELESGALIRVTAEGAFTGTLTNANEYLPYFGATDELLEVAVENNTLVIRDSMMAVGNKVHEVAEKMTADGVFNAGGTVTAVCPVCGTEEQWQDLSEITPSTLRTAAHYYLSKDIQIDRHYGFYADGCLHLNGHNITSQARVIYAEYVTVNVMGEGIVTGGFTDPQNKGYASVIDAPANVNLYGGTYTSVNDKPIVASRSDKEHCVAMYEGATIMRDTVPGLNLRVYDNGDFIMYGGTISGGTGTNGGNILVKTNSKARTPVFTIYGGIIENGAADLGGNIFTEGSRATVNIFGGIIRNGDVYIGSDAMGIAVAGDPAVSQLTLAGGKLLTLGALKENADITVSAVDGIFTETCVNAETYVAYFKAAQDDKEIQVQNEALAIVNK